jgi:hypothetical protein
MTVQQGVVIFNFPVWAAEYPEFSCVTQPQAQSYFNRACLLVDNTPCSPITDLFQRTVLLNMATAHIAALFAAQNGQAPRGIVGRISDASEGSVSVSTSYTEPTSDLQAYWNQTSYGSQYWASTLKYRTGFFVPPPIGINSNHGFGPGFAGRRFR